MIINNEKFITTSTFCGRTDHFMKRNKIYSFISLYDKYPPSQSCSCDICKSFCRRPGWWTVDEAVKAIAAGYGNRMMLEIAPELTFGVLSPTFKGCEKNYALQIYSKNGCNFWSEGLCELHDTGLEPIECRYCHHLRTGQGQKCHSDLERDWKTSKGQELVAKWVSTYLNK